VTQKQLEIDTSNANIPDKLRKVSGASERANGRAIGLFSRFQNVLDQSAIVEVIATGPYNRQHKQSKIQSVCR